MDNNEMTPFPSGPMPKNIQRWEDGPPYGRILLRVVGREGDRVLDEITDQWFSVVPADCGLGCKCAAEARWLPDFTSAPSVADQLRDLEELRNEEQALLRRERTARRTAALASEFGFNPRPVA